MDAMQQERLNSSLYDAESDHGGIGNNEVSAKDILPNILSADKIMGLSMPAGAPAPVEEVWAGISFCSSSCRLFANA